VSAARRPPRACGFRSGSDSPVRVIPQCLPATPMHHGRAAPLPVRAVRPECPADRPLAGIQPYRSRFASGTAPWARAGSLCPAPHSKQTQSSRAQDSRVRIGRMIRQQLFRGRSPPRRFQSRGGSFPVEAHPTPTPVLVLGKEQLRAGEFSFSYLLRNRTLMPCPRPSGRLGRSSTVTGRRRSACPRSAISRRFISSHTLTYASRDRIDRA